MTPSRADRQTGFTLIEIMVAMVIGLVITAGAGFLFISNKQTYNMAEAVARLQEAGRFSIETIAADLRMAGHLGCATPEQINVVASDHRLTLDDAFTAPLTFDPDSGLLTIRHASAASVELDVDMASKAADVVVATDSTLRNGSHALIANCTRADVFTVTNDPVDSTTGQQTLGHAESDDEGAMANTSNELSEAYEASAATAPRVRSFRIDEYVVDSEVDTNGTGDPIGALTRNGDTLAEGVERMELRFGECTAGGSIRYDDWAGVEPTRIVAVRVGLLLHSSERVLEEADTQSYRLAGVQIDPAAADNGNPSYSDDRRLRRAFSTTVDLRNEHVPEC